MESKATEIRQGSIFYPADLHELFKVSPSRLWCIGEPGILNGRLLGIIASRKVESDLAVKSTELLKQVASLDGTFISGWHSSLEEAALGILLARPARIVFCLAKSLDEFNPSAKIKELLNQKRALLLTHCSPNANRISRGASLRRNQLVVGFAKVVLVLSAPEGSASFKLARRVLNRGRPVVSPEHHMNESLLASGALPATIENIQRTFSSID